ncbi:hypothetical protein FDG92_gp42 [Arthrobacter phage Jasmine]|uniref:Uncharacterized protein n=1 Tax=Arthrobacter phage Jasmine TaxID=1772302 RepID=A0A0U4JLS3_9CAUD|nr:hypothetical protein FDG92_gp42 [Arthrobacter phage Jasmine]ALY09313.1 hypothetical protein JASMINE_43 [Arthrobacter phage Jasmine]
MATKTVAVTFQDGIEAHHRNREAGNLKRYAYFTNLDGLVKGDKVVVGTQHGLAVATYEGKASEDEAKYANNYLVSKVNVESLEDAKKIHEAEQELDALVEEAILKETRYNQAIHLARGGNENIQKMLTRMNIVWEESK